MQKIIYSFLAGVLLTGSGWFFTGRVNYGAIQATTTAISDSNRKSQQIGNSLTKRFDDFTSTIARIDNRSAAIKSTSISITNRSNELNSTGRGIKSGIRDVKTAVDRIENRNRQIVSIVGELRKTNETFYEASKKFKGKN